jgi:hypothetical protein
LVSIINQHHRDWFAGALCFMYVHGSHDLASRRCCQQRTNEREKITLGAH